MKRKRDRVEPLAWILPNWNMNPQHRVTYPLSHEFVLHYPRRGPAKEWWLASEPTTIPGFVWRRKARRSRK